MEPLVWDGISDSIRFNIKSSKLLPSWFTDRNWLTYGVELSRLGKAEPTLLERKNLHPADTVAAFLEEAGGGCLSDFSEAKGYNLPFGEDKRFRTRFVRAKDLGDGFGMSFARHIICRPTKQKKSAPKQNRGCGIFSTTPKTGTCQPSNVSCVT
jgi:hypothetical protein